MKKLTSRITTSVLVVALLTGNCNIPTTVEAKKSVEYKEYVVLVNDKKEDVVDEFIEDNGLHKETLELEDAYGIKVKATKQQINEISEKKDIVVSEDIILNAASKENWIHKPKIAVEDKNDIEWNIKMINATRQQSEENNVKVKVAILDSGIDYTDEIDVKERINLIPEEENVQTPFEDTSGHGTSIAGIIAAKDNGIGITGINPNVEIYSARILDDNNQAPLSRVVEGIYWAIDKKVNIISMSFGISQNSEVLHKAVQDAYEAGILIIASAGNNGGMVEYPAAYNEVMAVGSVDSEGTLSDTSARGKQLEITAPGECVKTTGSFGGELVTSGTSISVPHVVGVASLLWEKDINSSNEFIRQLLVASSNKSNDKTTENNGIVDLDYALSVYDEFKNNYTTNANVESIIEENTNEINTEDSEVVNARWTSDGHVTLADKAGNWCEVSATKIKILKLGIKYPDQQFATMTSNPQWHTATVSNVDNYISSYRCATLMARAIKKGNSLNTVSKPNGMVQANYTKMKKQLNGINWSTALNGISNTAANRALFVIGMAMHIVTDSYAHQSYVKVNGRWKHLNHDDDNCDSSSVHKKRFTIAGDAACDVLATYLVGDTGDHWEYVQAYDGTSFRLKRLVKYAQEQDTYDANTFGDLATLKKGDVAYAN